MSILGKVTTWGLTTVMLVPAILLLFTHLTYNITPSIPKGVYWVWPGSPPTRQRIVRLRNELKILYGMPGDTVEVNSAGTRINGGPLIPMSAPITSNSSYKAFPFGTYTLAEDQYWVLGEHPQSWDSRYIGPVPQSLIYGTATAVWTK